MNHTTDSLKDWLKDDEESEEDRFEFTFTREIDTIIQSLNNIELAMTLIKDKHWMQIKGKYNGN